MSGNGQRGRRTKPYRTSTGEDVPGLIQKKDGRWEIRKLGLRWSDPDEHRAVKKAKKLLGIADRGVTEIVGELPPRPVPSLSELDNVNLTAGNEWREHVPDSVLYPWIANELASNLESFAKKVGNLDLLKLRAMPMAGAALTLTRIIDNYKKHSPATDKAKQEATTPLNKLIAHAHATTLDDLTTEKLLAWKADIEEKIAGPATRKAYYSRIRSVISFGLKTGLDAVQIRAALDRAKVLWTGEAMPDADPQPISREDFHALLSKADELGNGWRPWLLLGLNLAMHLDEVCALKWESFDIDAGTYAAIRGKTRRLRIPRAAVLWPETIEAIKTLPRRGQSPYVFTSTHGSRYNRNTRGREFRELRTAADVDDAVTYDGLRDGSYTAAINDKAVEERFARVLAGHASPGLQDKYVLRNPACVKDACAAVYRVYGPFPVSRFTDSG